MKLLRMLDLERCPHCGVHKPNLHNLFAQLTETKNNHSKRYLWGFYGCARCGMVVSAFQDRDGKVVRSYYPKNETVDRLIPDRAREYLKQAIESIHTPAGSIMLSASSVDSMLKEKGLVDGTLFSRINKAAENGLITKDMKEWAHKIRLDANDQRHADNNIDLPTEENAKQTLEFAKALAQFMFILPRKIEEGIKNADIDMQIPITS